MAHNIFEQCWRMEKMLPLIETSRWNAYLQNISSSINFYEKYLHTCIKGEHKNIILLYYQKMPSYWVKIKAD